MRSRRAQSVQVNVHNALMRWQLASTFAVTAMSAGCYEETIEPCRVTGVLCPAGLACTGNTSGTLSGFPEEGAVQGRGARVV